jgi:hypothetical protein
MDVLDAMAFVQALFSNTTKEWFQKHGVATDKVTPAEILTALKLVCQVASICCPIINSMDKI